MVGVSVGTGAFVGVGVGDGVCPTGVGVGVGNGVCPTGVAVGGAYSCDVGKFYYQYQTLEQDAIFSPFGQDDFLLSTNMNSHVAGFKMPLTDNMGLHTWVLVSEADDLALGGPADTVYRFRVDLNINF